MSNLFSSVPITRIARSRHNLSHQVKTSLDAGVLVPILTELASPNSTWYCPSMEQFIRTMPMIAPVMDRLDVKADAFFIPLRLIWDDFEDYITLGPSGEFVADHPTIYATHPANLPAALKKVFNGTFATGGLGDYLNMPSFDVLDTQNFQTPKIDALPFRAYQLLWNEYYRNENLDDEIVIDKSSGNSQLSINQVGPGYSNFYDFQLKYRGWRKDYFTSALPTPQKGPAVALPSSHDIVSNGQLVLQDAEYEDVPLRRGIPNGSQPYSIATDTDGVLGSRLEYQSGLKLDSSNAPTIEELRYAETLQEFYEANARGGSRYKEYLMNIWHARSKDARLDRPERIGGYRGPITISDVDQTSQSDISPQATPAGKGISAGGSRMFKYKTTEWGIFMVIVSVQPKPSYFQGFRRWNLYRDVFDWPNPFFANLGEQEILNEELYFDPLNSDGKNESTFGYTPRYAEAKFIPDSVHGQFRTTLDYWHLARKFSSRPNLNAAFVHVNPSEVNRIFPTQVEDDNKFVATFYFHLFVKMHLPYYGVPRMIHSI